MENTGIKKEKVSLTGIDEETAIKIRFKFLNWLVGKSLMNDCPVHIMNYNRNPALTISYGVLYINISGNIQYLKTDSWKIFFHLSAVKNLELIEKRILELIKIEAITDLLDEIIIDKEDCYYMEPWNGYYLGMRQGFKYKEM